MSQSKKVFEHNIREDLKIQTIKHYTPDEKEPHQHLIIKQPHPEGHQRPFVIRNERVGEYKVGDEVDFYDTRDKKWRRGVIEANDGKHEADQVEISFTQDGEKKSILKEKSQIDVVPVDNVSMQQHPARRIPPACAYLMHFCADSTP